MTAFLRDLRYALHLFRQRPATAAAILLTLALGIGATTAVFGVVYGVLLKPLPYPQADRIVAIYESNPEQKLLRFPVSLPNFRDWTQQAQGFEALAAAGTRRVTLTGQGEPVALNAGLSSQDFWRVFQLHPVLGRTFSIAPGQPLEPVVVLSHKLWQDRFAGDPQILGRALLLDGKSYQVVGVAPPGFDLPKERNLWFPLDLNDPQASRGSRSLTVYGRVREGISVGRSEGVLRTIATNLANDYPESNLGWNVKVVSLLENTVGKVRTSLLLIFGMVAAVLLMACLNVTNLLLVELHSREKEIAIRIAVGASRWRILRQLLTESLLLSVAGGIAGLLLAILVIPALVALAGESLPRSQDVGVSLWVFLFALGTSILAGFAAGLVPALQKPNQNLQEILKDSGRSTGGQRSKQVSRGLAMLEIAFALVLLIASGLLVRSFLRLRATDPGFDSQGVLTARISLPPNLYPDSEAQAGFYRRLLDQLATIPEIKVGALGFPAPLDGARFSLSYSLEGAAASGEERGVDVLTVSPSYFSALSIQLTEGRTFAEAEAPGSPLEAVVSEGFAKRAWGERAATGQRLTFDDPASPDARWLAVVGVVRDVHQRSLAESSGGEVYRSALQFPTPSTTVIAKGVRSSLALSAEVRATIRTLDPGLPVLSVLTLDELVEKASSQSASTSMLGGLFALLALILAVIGVYGVSSQLMQQRKQEIGVRMALGAQRSDILRLVLRHCLTMILPGIVLGVVIALWAVKAMASLVFNVDLHDPQTFLIGALALTAAGFAASFLPAREASDTDPMAALLSYRTPARDHLH